MKSALPVALAVVMVGLAGCTSEIPPGFSLEEYDGPSALLDHRDVPIDDSAQDFVDCGTQTHLFVEYFAGDDGTGDFSVRVYAESSRQKTDDEGNPEQDWIPVFPYPDEPDRFSGAEDGKYDRMNISGSEGTWKLEVHRTLEHDGRFVAQLVCA